VSRSTVIVHDPSDGSLVGELDLATRAEVDAAAGSAAKSAREWARTAPAERAAAVRACAERLDAASEELALLTTREMGKPIDDARGGVDAGIDTLRQYAELGPLHRGRSLQGEWTATDLMVPQPRGVVAAITP
jgi:acyl-CoA reductase-like NAD-dependent aldehyde dehydrogenase